MRKEILLCITILQLVVFRVTAQEPTAAKENLTEQTTAYNDSIRHARKQAAKELRRQKIANRNFHYNILGGPSYTPDFGVLVGGSALMTFSMAPKDSTLKRSVVPMAIAFMFDGGINLFSKPQLFFKGDRFRILYTQSECEGQLVGIDSVRFSLFDGCDGKQVAAVLFDTGEGGSNTYWDKGGVSLKRMFLKAPLRYNRISSRFSYRRKHPVTGKIKAHTAVDYAAPTGTEVYAIGDGTVTKCGWDPTGGGNRIRIKHMQGYESSYMHLSRFASGIRVGTRVSQGQLIGYVGATGTATGPHLDFRIWERGRPIDPLTLNSPASEPLDTAYLSEFNALYESYMREVGATPAAGTVSAPQVGEATATDGREAGIAPGSASGSES